MTADADDFGGAGGADAGGAVGEGGDDAVEDAAGGDEGCNAGGVAEGVFGGWSDLWVECGEGAAVGGRIG